MATFTCGDCHNEIPIKTEGGTGYAETKDGKRVCYACCGVRDRAGMIETGKATLYLALGEGELHRGRVINMGVSAHNAKLGKLSNWPGTLELYVPAGAIKRGRHNIAGSRYDVWFTGPDGKPWHGVQYGENTQLCHCRRTKSA